MILINTMINTVVVPFRVIQNAKNKYKGLKADFRLNVYNNI